MGLSISVRHPLLRFRNSARLKLIVNGSHIDPMFPDLRSDRTCDNAAP